MGKERIVIDTNIFISAIKWDGKPKAVENNAGYIISGDNHLLKLKEYQAVKIVTAAEFLQL